MSAHLPSSLFATCERVGRGARVRGRPAVENLGRITIGHAFVLNATPVPTHLVTGPGASLEIGDRVTIDHGVGITAHAHVRIGHDVVVGPFSMILDTDFHVADDFHARPECTPIVIGDGATIGANVTVLRGAVIGAGVRVAPGSVVRGTVPDGARIGGVPARPLDPDAAVVVPTIVARAFGLVAPPHLDAACAAVRGWDADGSAHVLLALEEAFGVELHPSDVARARCVRDLVHVVTSAPRVRSVA